VAEQNQSPNESSIDEETTNEETIFDELTSLILNEESNTAEKPDELPSPPEVTPEEGNENIQTSQRQGNDHPAHERPELGAFRQNEIEIPNRGQGRSEPPPEQTDTSKGGQAPNPPVDFPIPAGGVEFPGANLPPPFEPDTVDLPVVEPVPVEILALDSLTTATTPTTSTSSTTPTTSTSSTTPTTSTSSTTPTTNPNDQH